MNQNNKPKCFNRPDCKDSLLVQDGWDYVSINSHVTIRVPVMKRIKSVLSKNCNLNDEFGAAKMYNWNCKGCKHYENT